jgi:hypothetical protein
VVQSWTELGEEEEGLRGFWAKDVGSLIIEVVTLFSYNPAHPEPQQTFHL